MSRYVSIVYALPPCLHLSFSIALSRAFSRVLSLVLFLARSLSPILSLFLVLSRVLSISLSLMRALSLSLSLSPRLSLSRFLFLVLALPLTFLLLGSFSHFLPISPTRTRAHPLYFPCLLRLAFSKNHPPTNYASIYRVHMHIHLSDNTKMY